ncbi:acyl carrier protein [Ralstonia syzygii]|uniref:Putative acyl carrier protein n=1 Tax=Ralstonia syzygii R24 TaxID=907261 RepID=G3AAR4_9RALS|nr:acyl carrier protein [Ralstonia syzygii]CCA87469.1 putative acyl carrier protein [Ralstonia syzygii R24]
MTFALAVPNTASDLATPDLDETALQRWLIAHVASILEAPEDSIDPALPFSHFGLDSVAAVGLSGDLETLLDRKLPATLTWDFPTIELLARHLAQS